MTGRFFCVHCRFRRSGRRHHRGDRPAVPWVRPPAAGHRHAPVRTLFRAARGHLRLRRRRITRVARAHRGGAAHALALRRPAPRGRRRRRHSRRGVHTAGARPQPRRRARPARPPPQERHAEPHQLLQGQGGGDGAELGRAERVHNRGLRIDRQPRQLAGGVRGAGRAARGDLHPRRPRAAEGRRHRRVRRHHRADRGHLRRRQPALRGARRRPRLGFLQHQPAPLLQRGEQDAYVRDGRAARLAAARRDRHPGRLRLPVREAPQGGG